MDKRSRQAIAEIEALGVRTGVGRIEAGNCPRGAPDLVVCAVCPYGHILECHYPLTCEKARCNHYRYERELGK